jgi:hypothetical protein
MATTTLLRISLDVLALIAERLDGVETMLLAQTCPRLHRALYFECPMTCFQVCARKADHTFRWPLAIARLTHLTHLSICLGSKTSVGPISRYLAQPLPITLQLLRLQFKEAEELFALAPLELALVMMMRKSVDENSAPVTDLKSAFPNLHTLDLFGKAAIRPEAVSRLPPTLTDLRITGLNWDDNCIADLPRGLLHLRIQSTQSMTTDSFPSLPPHLETLDYPGYRATPDDYLLLPPSVTRFKHMNAIQLTPPSNDSISFGTTSSSGNTKATATNKTKKTANPRRQTAVAMSRYDDPSSSTKASLDVNQLPRALTSLHIRLFELTPSQESEVLLKLPYRLTKLRIQTTSSLSRLFVSSLPKTLKKLTISCDGEADFMALEDWPQGLRRLTFFPSKPSLAGVSPLPLPDSVVSLRLGQHFPANPLNLGKLPPHLTRLAVANAEAIGNATIKAFPRSLTELAIFNLKRHITDPCLADLPPNLTSLYLDGDANITDEAVQHIPRSVTDLTLDITNISTWNTANAFQRLPPGLRFFGMPSASHFKKAHLSLLPPSIRILNLGESPIFPLPKSIIKLRVMNYNRVAEYIDSTDPCMDIHVMEPIPDSVFAKQPANKKLKHDHQFW